jgi:CheY-like chemotaxis protein
MKRLLIVEDSDRFRRLMVGMLKGYYDEIYECSRGEDANAAYARYKPDWTLVDMEMKGTDGLAATRKLKSAFPDAHVAVLTQHRDIDIQHQVQSAGAEKLILKDNLLELRYLPGGR